MRTLGAVLAAMLAHRAAGNRFAALRAGHAHLVPVQNLLLVFVVISLVDDSSSLRHLVIYNRRVIFIPFIDIILLAKERSCRCCTSRRRRTR